MSFILGPVILLPAGIASLVVFCMLLAVVIATARPQGRTLVAVLAYLALTVGLTMGFAQHAETLWVEISRYETPDPKPWPDGYRISDIGIVNIAVGNRDVQWVKNMYHRALSGGFAPNCEPRCNPGFGGCTYVNDPQGFSVEIMAVARWLEGRPGIRRVHYPGLESHPQHALARHQQRGHGGLVSFEIEGGREDAFAFIDATRWLSITANFGDAKSTITHPASTTHGRLKPEEREAAGIPESLIRVSVGLEDVEDIIAELDAGLSSLRAPLRAVAAG